MPTRAEIRDWVRQHTLVEADDYADDKIDNVINQGIRDLSTQFSWPFLEASTTILFEEGQYAYDLPADFAHLSGVLRDDCACLLREMTPREAWVEYGEPPKTGTNPEYFYIWADQLYGLPQKGSGSTPSTLTVFYLRRPTLLTSDIQEPEFPPQFHMMLAEYAAAKVWEREEDLEKSNYHMERYYTGVEAMARFYLNRADDTPVVVGEPNRQRRRGPRMPWLEV